MDELKNLEPIVLEEVDDVPTAIWDNETCAEGDESDD